MKSPGKDHKICPPDLSYCLFLILVFVFVWHNHGPRQVEIQAHTPDMCAVQVQEPAVTENKEIEEPEKTNKEEEKKQEELKKEEVVEEVVKRVETAPFRIKRVETLYEPIISEAARSHSLDPALIKAVIMAESSFNPGAVSKKGAKGLMQLMPQTAAAMGVGDIFNPEHNIKGGAKYLRKLINRFNGNLELSLAAYNAGAGKVRYYKGIPPFKSTQVYIKKVFQYYNVYRGNG